MKLFTNGKKKIFPLGGFQFKLTMVLNYHNSICLVQIGMILKLFKKVQINFFFRRMNNFFLLSRKIYLQLHWNANNAEAPRGLLSSSSVRPWNHASYFKLGELLYK